MTTCGVYLCPVGSIWLFWWFLNKKIWHPGTRTPRRQLHLFACCIFLQHCSTLYMLLYARWHCDRLDFPGDGWKRFHPFILQCPARGRLPPSMIILPLIPTLAFAPFQVVPFRPSGSWEHAFGEDLRDGGVTIRLVPSLYNDRRNIVYWILIGRYTCTLKYWLA